MKIAFFELEGWEKPVVQEALPAEEIYFYKDKLSAETLPPENDFEVISVFVNSLVDKVVLDCFPNLKMIVTRSTGYDHIDLAECKNRGILVSYVPGYGDNTVAEFAFGLLLNLTRKIYAAADRIKETRSFALDNLRGIDLKGKTIGIIGTGRIGREMIKISKGFGMNILAADPFPNDSLCKEMGFEYCPIEDLLSKSDIISIHCPYSESTHHLINKNNISQIKRGAYLVNTARGPIVESEALLTALKEGILAGAGLDVLEEEGDTKDELNFLLNGHPKEEELKLVLQNNALISMSNVIITPHNAFNTIEALERILGTTLQNIKGFLNGKVENLVKQ